jgi:hypothetical protein
MSCRCEAMTWAFWEHRLDHWVGFALLCPSTQLIHVGLFSLPVLSSYSSNTRRDYRRREMDHTTTCINVQDILFVISAALRRGAECSGFWGRQGTYWRLPLMPPLVTCQPIEQTLCPNPAHACCSALTPHRNARGRL